jgi:phosphoribosylglycinamide formyltransferase-1
VPVLSGDTAEILAGRVLAAEHRLYPMAMRLVASGRIRVVAEKTIMLQEVNESLPLFSPSG